MRRKHNYRSVSELPGTALSVANYAKQRECNTSNIYKEYRTAKEKEKVLPYEIVVFNDINFIIPK